MLAALAAPAAADAGASELDRGRELHLRGERVEALVHYRAFLADPAASEADRAMALNNVCVLLHDLGEVQEALGFCERALALRRTLGDERRLSRTLNNLGLALQSAGRYGEARDAYREALAGNRARSDDAAAAVNLANLGLLASDEGRYGLALDRHLEVEALAERHEGEPWAEEQRRVAWINRGVVYEKLGAFDQALELYQQLVSEEERRPNALGPRRWATVLLNLGTVYRNLGDPYQAASAYRRAAEIFEREDDRAALSSARLNLGQVLYTNLARPAEAEQELTRALELSRETGDRGVEIQALFLLGEATLERNPEAARASFTRCLELAEDSGSAEGEWWARYGLGRLASRGDAGESDLDAALEHLRAAVEVLERTRAQMDDRDLRGGFFAGWRHVYEAAVDVLWRQWQGNSAGAGGAHVAEAFALVQRAKQRELAEALGGPVGDIGAVADLERMRAALDGAGSEGEAALVEYFFTAESLFVFRLGARTNPRTADLHWWRVDADSAADAARSALSIHAALASGEPPAPEPLRRLAELLGPAWGGDAGTEEPGLGKPGLDRLLLAPDGVLRYLPFEILPTSPSDPASGRLVERYVVSYLPSASALRPPRALPDPRFALIGLADPALDAAADSQGELSADSRPTLRAGLFVSRFALERLPSGRREIEDAARRLTGEHQLLTDRQATEAALRDAVSAGSRVLHLAAHTVIDERPGGGAAVLLTPSGEAVGASGVDASDGLLGPADLARLDLRTRLTVLAACRTALPPGGTGDTLHASAFGSLTGSFLAAGSDAVLATLWDVGDAATEAFMQQFYYELGRGLPPARALAEVKRRMAHDPTWSAPHLWSAYVLVGDAPTVASSGRAGRWSRVLGVGLLAACLVVFGVWAVLKRRRPRHTTG